MLLSESTDEVRAGWVPVGRMEILLISDGQTAARSAVRRVGSGGGLPTGSRQNGSYFQATVVTMWHLGTFVFEMRGCAVPPLCGNA